MYARAVVAEEGSEPIDVDTDKFSFFSAAKGITVNSNNTATCHSLP